MSFARFEWMDAWVDDPDVGVEVMAVLAVIMRHARNGDGMAWPSQATIAEKIGRSDRSVRRYLTKAEELGYVLSQNDRGKSTSYTPVIPRTVVSTPDTDDHGTPDSGVHPGHECPVTPDSGDRGTPDTDDHGTPDSGVHPGQWCPPPRTPVSGDPGHTCPPNNTRTTQRTSQEAAAASPAHEAVAVAEESDPPSQRLLALAQSAGLHLTLFQAETVWSEVSARLPDDDAWRYLRWKIGDLAEADIPRRAQYRYLCSDVDDWMERQELSVGRHTDAHPAVRTKPDDLREDEPSEPAPKRTLHVANDGGAWSEASDALRGKMSHDSWQRWISPLDAGGIDGGELVLLARDRFEADYTTDKYADLIDSTLADGLTARIEVRGEVEVVIREEKGAA